MTGRVIAMLLLTGIPAVPALHGQMPDEGERAVEELLLEDDMERAAARLMQVIETLQEDPVDLNSASAGELRSCGLFTPYQVSQLIRYRERYGALFTVYELAGVPGFRSSRLRLIAPFLRTGTAGPLPDRREHAAGKLMGRTGRSFPLPAGYDTNGKAGERPGYAGSPQMARLRFIYGSSRFSGGLSYEKDAGETFHSELRPQFLCGYLRYCGKGILQEIIAGSFRIHHGTGLVNGTGFLYAAGMKSLPALTSGGIRPYASSGEHAFKNGIACRLEKGRMQLSLWGSCRSMDLSLGRLPEDPGRIDWTLYQRSTGLHRTVNEVSGRWLANRYNAGARVSVRLKRLTVGLLYESDISRLTSRGRDSLKLNPRPSPHHALSISWQWYGSRLALFGEAASYDLLHRSVLSGWRIHFNEFLEGVFLLYHYAPSFRGILPSSITSGNRVSNENGLVLRLQAEAGERAVAVFSAGIFRIPAPKYLTLVPSHGYRAGLTIRNSGQESWQWRIRLLARHWQDTPSRDLAGLRPLVDHYQARLDTRVIHRPAEHIRWQVRWILSTPDIPSIREAGQAFLQQVILGSSDPWRLKFQFLVFQVPRWENRIYIYDPGMPYEFRFPVCNGTGQRFTAVASLRTGRRTHLHARLTLSSYPGRKSIGSGGEKVDGHHQCQVALQFQRTL